MRRMVLRLLVLLTAVTALLAPGTARADDPRNVFYTTDKHFYTSPWFDGAHRIMVGFGCTFAPYYAPDPRCPDHHGGDHGFHHGLDVAMDCGTKVYAGIRGRVVSNDTLGPAYGVNPLLLRNDRIGVDIVLGHTITTYVKPGDFFTKGQLLALSADSGAPDGCHLHFEVRDDGGGLSTARWPKPLLDLTVSTDTGTDG